MSRARTGGTHHSDTHDCSEVGTTPSVPAPWWRLNASRLQGRSNNLKTPNTMVKTLNVDGRDNDGPEAYAREASTADLPAPQHVDFPTLNAPQATCHHASLRRGNATLHPERTQSQHALHDLDA